MIWVTGHRRIEGNKICNQMARMESEHLFMGTDLAWHFSELFQESCQGTIEQKPLKHRVNNRIQISIELLFNDPLSIKGL
jgi:hypothetical protein